MLPIGLIVTLDMALGRDGVRTPAERARYASYLLGIFREDVCLLPGTAVAIPSLSTGHLWPGAPRCFARRYGAALRAARSGDELRAAFLLGRAIHILIDMGCPAHARRTWHYLADPFERYVEAHAEELVRKPLPALDPAWNRASPQAIACSLAQQAQREATDGTQTLWGRWLRRTGMRRPLTRRDVAPQVHRLIPLAAAHLRLALNNFWQQAEGLEKSSMANLG